MTFETDNWYNTTNVDLWHDNGLKFYITRAETR